jgi:hypothetical protein
MRNFRIIIAVFSFLVTGFGALAQTTVQDTVCVSASAVDYYVTNTVGSTYSWTLTGGGTITTGQGTNAIKIDWGATIGTDTLKVVETNAQLCVGEPVALAITRVAAPVADAGSDVSIGTCLGQSTTLDASGSTGGGTLTYSWSSNPAGFTSTSISPSVSPTVNTTYTVTVTSSYGCSSTDDVVVTVDAAPVAIAAADATIGNCAGQSATIDGSSSTGTGIGYAWSSNPVGFTSTSASASVSPAVSTTYTLTVTDTYGCTATDDQVVNVAAAPVAAVTATEDTIGSCAGQSTTIDASSSTGVALTFSWSSTPAGFTSTSASNSVSPAVTTTYTVVVTDDYSCTATDNIVITVDAAPVADAGSDANLCAGNSTTLDGTASTGSDLSYSWSSSPAGFSSTLASPSASPAVTTTYTLTTTDKHGCTSTDDVVITVFQAATANAGTDASICEGEDVVLNGTATNYSTIVWSTSGDGSFTNGTTLTPDYTPGTNDISNGTVNLTITVQGTGPCPAAADSKTVTINPKPTTSPIFHF